MLRRFLRRHIVPLGDDRRPAGVCCRVVLMSACMYLVSSSEMLVMCGCWWWWWGGGGGGVSTGECAPANKCVCACW
jgi:hypothetical protein